MGVKGIWKANATALVLLIIVNTVLMLAGMKLWIAVGIPALLLAMFLSFRQGMGIGHDACGISSTVEGARQAGEKVYRQLDAGYLSQVWSAGTGLRGMLLSALIPYAAACAYIVVTLLGQDAPSMAVPVVLSRTAAWVLSLPYWPILMIWHEDFIQLTPDVAAVLLITPFVLPACTFAGYMQGPKLWAQSEAAMLAGRRRAKARARVGRKMAPKQQKPEI
ncbi:MAG: hypothetical protein IJI26_04950 [Clostridia bacterium]|nr:hypothetical protein [Clostridia bacterium]